jgi:DNA polymerase-3 subunit delta
MAQAHAVEYLKPTGERDVPPIVILWGKERFLKLEVLQLLKRELFGDEAEESFGDSTVQGKTADYLKVMDELKTVSMWQPRRLLILEEADEFVTAHRAQLENYVLSPARKSVFVIDVKTWPSNTKLAKLVKDQGLAIECQELAGAKLISWVMEWTKQRHKKTMMGQAASELVNLAGEGMGFLEREISKLVDYIGDRDKITPEDVQLLVGGWKTETTWTMLNAVRDQNYGEALELLDQLLDSGEAPMKLLGGIGFVFRKYAEATQRVQQGRPLTAALQEAKLHPREIDVGSQYLKRLGRERASQLMQILRQMDLNLKGGNPMKEQIQLEQMLLQLGGKISL